MIYLFDAMASVADDFYQSVLPLFPAQRRQHILSYRCAVDRSHAALRYLLLVRALQKEYAIWEFPIFGYAAQGKPFLADHPDIYFSLSHCPQAVACAVSPHPVGIDVESASSFVDWSAEPAVMETVFSPAERTKISQSAYPQQTMCLLWTQKESIVKCQGTGLVDNLNHVAPTDGTSLWSHFFADQGYAVALCTRI